MITLAAIIAQFKGQLIAEHGQTLLPSQRQALNAMQACRTALAARMQAQCEACATRAFVPHSCGNRACPHCQHHESQQWIDRQLARLVPGEYFLITFTLPAQLRDLAWQHQRAVYGALMQCAWDTLRTFSQNDRTLHGTPGAIAVLHTHSRRLDYHPHVHVVMPAAAVDRKRRLWRAKKTTGKSPFLFHHTALAKVFRAKFLAAMAKAELCLVANTTDKWVVDCKHVGAGDKALKYLGRYLYRGVIAEQDIVACTDDNVTFRYRESKTRCWKTRTLPGVAFLLLLLRHVLPKRFRRSRNFGFLHPNSKRLIALVQLLYKITPNLDAWRKPRPTLQCPCCGGRMKVIRTRIPPRSVPLRPPDGIAGCPVM